MSKPLRVLLVEDSELDAAHLLLELRRGGFDPNATRIETAEELEVALRADGWDVILCDYHLPRFSAPDALRIFKWSGRDIPFIVVSGVVGEETGVELMRAGADDYVLKHALTRLAAAVDHQVTQARQRIERRRAEDLFRAVLRASPMPSFVVDRASGFVIDGSDSFRRQFLNQNPGGGRGLFDLVQFTHPERIEQLLARGSGTAWYAVYHAGDVARMANVRCYSVEHAEQSYAYLILEDVTEQHYLKAAFDAVPDPLLIVSAQQKLLYGNRAAEELFGNLYFGADVAPLLEQRSLGARWWSRLERRDVQRVEFRDQPYDATAVPFRFAGEGETSTILTLRDMSDEEELRRLATHDALTGIFNLRHFESVLAEQVAGGGTLVLLDLDFFKPINDELGHAVGDKALMMFSAVIRHELRPGDAFARIGGDEFAVFFPRTAADAAVQYVAAIYDRLKTSPFQHDGVARPFSASAGIAAARPDDSPETLKRRADDALYQAKRQGRGRWVVAG